MRHVNFEFKARLRNESHARAVLEKLRVRYMGTDHQVDTYFLVPRGRLKIREGRIENALIFYQRCDSRRPRQARIEMMLLPRRNSLKKILTRVLAVLAVVDKRREIYLAGNVKIHLDRVRGLGEFLEFEAISRSKDLSRVRKQAREFQRLFGISSTDLVGRSYSDLVLERRRPA